MLIPKNSFALLKLMLSGFMLICLALVWAAAQHEVNRRQDKDLRDAQSQMEVQAEVLGEFSSSTIKRLDEVLLYLQAQWPGDLPLFAAQAKTQQDRLTDISFEVSVIDRNGLLAYSSMASTASRVDLSQREHFLVHREFAGVDRLFISHVVRGLVSGKSSIQFTRPVYRDRNFMGVLVLSVSPQLFSDFAGKLASGGHSQLYAVRRSGDIVASYPYAESVLGRQAKDLGILADADQPDYLSARRLLPEVGMTLVAEQSRADILSISDAGRQTVWATAALVSLLLGVCWFLLYRSMVLLASAQQELLGAKQRAEQANASKSFFLSNTNHEIRTPLNAVLGMLQLLIGTDLTALQRDYAEKSQTAAKYLLALINDILDFSKMEAGKLVLEPQAFRLDRMTQDLALMLSANVGRKPVEVLFDVDARLPEVLHGDVVRLQQVLLKLSSNSLKFTEQGEVRLTLRLQQLEADVAWVEFAVTDTGIGIAADQQASIFEVFAQAEASTTRRYGGSGLGLSISQQLVQLLGGELRLQSVAGQGSKFFFSLPLQLVNPALTGLQQPAAACLPAGLSVLVVDDHASALALMVTVLQDRGLQAQGVGSGSQALQLLRQCSQRQAPAFDVVLLDWQMPEMDGWETARQIKALDFGQQVPPRLIMVTANGRALLAHRSEAEQAMLHGFLAKPVSPEMLLQAMAHALGAPGSSAPQGAAPAQRGLQGMRVLVVEDNLLNQQVVEELLAREGALVSLAANGQLGVEAVAVADPPFDVVLMDIQMPVLDGWAATRAIRNELGMSALPIIAMSANVMDEDKAESLQAGMNDHVGKPFEVASLVSLLRRHLGWAELSARAADRPAGQLTVAAVMAQVDGDDPPSMGEIDFAQALEWVGGNAPLYREFATAYVQDVANYADRLAQHLAQAEQQDAKRLMHNLKGLSATVGARHLADFAAKQEAALKAGLPDAQGGAEMVQQTRTCIGIVSRQIGQLVDSINGLMGQAA